MNERLLNGNEVAQYLSISRAFAYQLMRLGRIRSIRIGRSIRVRPSDLEHFLAMNVLEEKGDNSSYQFPGSTKIQPVDNR